MTSTERTTTGGTTDRSVPATSAWRPVDVVVASVLGVAGGLLFILWNIGSNPLRNALGVWPPASALVAGVWLLPGVLVGLVVRKPGAATYGETVAAVVSMLVGNEWGFSTLYYGLAQGLGAEAVLAAFRYRRWSLPVVLAAGGGAGLVSGLLDTISYNAALSTVHQVLYVLFLVISGVVLAGGLSWLLARALRASGALTPLASGRGATRV